MGISLIIMFAGWIAKSWLVFVCGLFDFPVKSSEPMRIFGVLEPRTEIFPIKKPMGPVLCAHGIGNDASDSYFDPVQGIQ
jgi:hypothetical protein